MKLIFALGNPGSEYTGTRHNAGFMAIDAFAKNYSVSFAEKTKFRACIAEVNLEDDKVLLAKPTTFYNEVGVSARSLIDFYKLSPDIDILVIHDDLALPFGTIRVRKKGSDAGNNGIKSLNAHIGPDYTRLRVGIGVPERTNEDSSFVLDRFTSTEVKVLIDSIIPKTCELASNFLVRPLEDTSLSLLPPTQE